MSTHSEPRSKIITITSIVCATLIIIIGIGGWIYVEKQQLIEKNQEFQQKQASDKEQQEESLKRLKYQECETDQRAQEARGDLFGIENCELKL